MKCCKFLLLWKIRTVGYGQKCYIPTETNIVAARFTYCTQAEIFNSIHQTRHHILAYIPPSQPESFWQRVIFVRSGIAIVVKLNLPKMCGIIINTV